jgi:hypothetical protein
MAILSAERAGYLLRTTAHADIVDHTGIVEPGFSARR